MANEEHLAKLREGVEDWNAWREANPEVRPDLRAVILNAAKLTKANLFEADLREADLRGADLRRADLRETALREPGRDRCRAVVPGQVAQRGADLTPVVERDGIRRRTRTPALRPSTSCHKAKTRKDACVGCSFSRVPLG